MTTTEIDLDELAAKLEERRVAQRVHELLGQRLTFEEIGKIQEATRLARLAEAKAEQQRQHTARARAVERRRELWKANAPARERAQAELVEIEPQLEDLRARVDELEDRQRDLLGELTRWAPR